MSPSVEEILEEVTYFLASLVQVFGNRVVVAVRVTVVRLVGRMLVERHPSRQVGQAFLVPLGGPVRVLRLHGQVLDFVALAVLEELTVAGRVEDAQLDRVPLLCIDRLQVALAGLLVVVVDRCAGLTDADPEGQLEISGWVLEAVDAVGVVLVFGDPLPQRLLQLLRLLLGCEFRYLRRGYGRVVNWCVRIRRGRFARRLRGSLIACEGRSSLPRILSLCLSLSLSVNVGLSLR